MALADFGIEPFSHGGITHDVYFAGDGPHRRAVMIFYVDIVSLGPLLLRM